MCGRYALFSLPEAVARRFGAVSRGLPAAAARPRYNIAPGTAVLVVCAGTDGRPELRMVRWGFVPHWKRPGPEETAGRSPPINARVETASTSPMFRDAFRERRCLVPADAFYEWKALSGPPGRGGKQPMVIRARDGDLLALAAIWEPSPDGGATAAILTRPSRGAVASIHERMPVILPESAWTGWLDVRSRDRAAVAREMMGEDSGAPTLDARPVSRRVNNPAFDGAACMELEDGGSDEPPGGLFSPGP